MSDPGTRTARLAARHAGREHRQIVRRTLWAVLLATVALAAVGPISGAGAAPARVTIQSPTTESVINNANPTFTGTTVAEEEEEFLTLPFQDRVAVVIRNAAGEVVEEPSVESPIRHVTWSVGPVAPLGQGAYTAQAVESEVEPIVLGAANVLDHSPVIHFTVDTIAPAVTITSPANGSTTTLGAQTFAGAAGTAGHDQQTVTVQLFAGSSIGSQPALEGVAVPATEGHWSATLGGLTPGTYTARAEQADSAGNVGTSAPVTFTVTVPVVAAAPTPPVASFKWFPAVPVVGEAVSLVSSSTDQASPLTGFAWSLAGNGVFTAGKQVTTTTFTTPGNHVVQLRATAADGLSSVATETIHVAGRRLTLMDPFPVVRIAGTVTYAGVNISLLTVQAPVGARVTVHCRGHGCRTASESRLAASSSKKRKSSMIVIAFRRFQGPLRAGAVLEIRVFKHGVIGKYTRFVIRRGLLPVRVDTCVGEAGLKPIACPSG